MKRVLSILLLLACLGIWFTAPFMSINMMTLNDQPSAADLFGDELTQYFDLSDTPPSITALGVIACIVIALFAALFGWVRLKRGIALLGELTLMWGYYQMYLWTKGSNYLPDTVGSGFWGIAILLLFVAVLGKDQKRRKE